MWSGPRNISTTMMRSFENRSDTAVIDEPFYGHYLSVTGLDHPMRAEVLAAQPTRWQDVVDDLLSNHPAPVWFQKQMTQHITPEIDLDWLSQMEHFFLIRDPRLMAASFMKKMGAVTSEDLGLDQELALFREVETQIGKTPPVVDAQDILRNPEAVLTLLCDRLDLVFDSVMLSWPAGPRESDGVWAPHWYDAVERSTGFGPPVEEIPLLSGQAVRVAEACRGAYEELADRKLSVR